MLQSPLVPLSSSKSPLVPPCSSKSPLVPPALPSPCCLFSLLLPQSLLSTASPFALCLLASRDPLGTPALLGPMNFGISSVQLPWGWSIPHLCLQPPRPGLLLGPPTQLHLGSCLPKLHLARHHTSSTRLSYHSGYALVSHQPPAASGLQSSSYTSSLCPYGCVRLFLNSGSTSILTRSGSAGLFRIPASSSIACAICFALALLPSISPTSSVPVILAPGGPFPDPPWLLLPATPTWVAILTGLWTTTWILLLQAPWLSHLPLHHSSMDCPLLPFPASCLPLVHLLCNLSGRGRYVTVRLCFDSVSVPLNHLFP